MRIFLSDTKLDNITYCGRIVHSLFSFLVEYILSTDQVLRRSPYFQVLRCLVLYSSKVKQIQWNELHTQLQLRLLIISSFLKDLALQSNFMLRNMFDGKMILFTSQKEENRKTSTFKKETNTCSTKAYNRYS